MKLHFQPKTGGYDWVYLLQLYKQYATKQSTVLEIGASRVELTKQISPYCDKLIAIELLPERIVVDFDNVKHLIGDWQNLSAFIQPESIDIAISSHVIEHVQDDLKAINELYKVLKPKGIALISTPNRKRIVRAIIEIFTGERKFPHWEHIREYIEEDLIRLLQASNFKKFAITPVVFGIHGGQIFFYLESVPKIFRRFANFFVVYLFKE